MVLLVVSAAALAAYAALLIFYYRQWKRLPTYLPGVVPTVRVSVIVAARDEEKTLPHLLQDLAGQDYPPHLWEVIVVNDFSTDNTAALARLLPPNFRMIKPGGEPWQSSKKKALAAGIAAATGELMVITDADCRLGKKWMATMAAFYREKGASFVAAPVKYIYESTLVQVFQGLDFLMLQGITAAGVAANVHTMCNGANLAYPKMVFENVNGFDGIDSVPTGDDMLLMHKIWQQAPTGVVYLKSADAIVTTSAVATWRGLFSQRKRWASKTLVYRDKRIVAALVLVLLINLLPLALLGVAFFRPVYFLACITFLLAKGAAEWPLVSSVATFYNERRLLRYFFPLQPLHVFYTVLVGLASQFGSYQWKGRTVPPPAKIAKRKAHEPA